MNTFASTFARVALTVLSLAASPALAEGEGNGDPYAFASAPQVSVGRPFAAEVWQDALPQPTGNADQAASMAELLPSSGNETPVQTASSLPFRSTEGMVAYAGTRRVVPALGTRVLASRTGTAQHLAYGALSGAR